MSELSTLALARAGDALEIAAMSRDLIEQGLPWSWTAPRVRRCIADRDTSVVVARNPRRGDSRFGNPSRRGDSRFGDLPAGAKRGIDAFAIMHFGDDVAHLNLLAVAPEHRRRGLGCQLMEWLVTTAVEAGIGRIDLELRDRNAPARAFYESLGFAAGEVMPGYYQGREAALRMSRRLAKNRD